MTVAVKTLAHSTFKGAPKPLFTFEWTYPRFIHAEELTHRMLCTSTEMVETMILPDGVMYDRNLSRNASSSRAIPINTMMEAIRRDPAMPIRWGLNGAGMQDHGEMSEEGAAYCKKLWLEAMAFNMKTVGKMQTAKEAPHKQVANRLLEPWAHITVVVTATEWANFLALRRHPAAQPEIKLLADMTWDAMQASTPTVLEPGEWHLPYIQDFERGALFDLPEEGREDGLMDLIKVSVARCARTSFRSHRNKITTIEEDIGLYDRLLGNIPLHASPAEHQATADTFTVTMGGQKMKKVWAAPELHGNLKGFVQFRQMLPNQNITEYAG